MTAFLELLVHVLAATAIVLIFFHAIFILDLLVPVIMIMAYIERVRRKHEQNSARKPKPIVG